MSLGDISIGEYAKLEDKKASGGGFLIISENLCETSNLWGEASMWGFMCERLVTNLLEIELDRNKVWFFKNLPIISLLGCWPYNSSLLSFLLKRKIDNNFINSRKFVVIHLSAHLRTSVSDRRYARRRTRKWWIGEFKNTWTGLLGVICNFYFNLKFRPILSHSSANDYQLFSRLLANAFWRFKRVSRNAVSVNGVKVYGM